MAYATPADMVDAYGEDELVRVSTRDGADMGAVDQVRVQARLDEASAVMDTHLRRRYIVPITLVPVPVATPVPATSALPASAPPTAPAAPVAPVAPVVPVVPAVPAVPAAPPPLAPTMMVLRRCCCAIARKMLRETGHTEPSDQVLASAKHWTDWLKAVGDGSVTLDGAVLAGPLSGARVSDRPAFLAREGYGLGRGGF